MNKYFMTKLQLIKLIMSKINMAKPTNESIFYGKTNYAKNNYI
jgi:hypothetical protein